MAAIRTRALLSRIARLLTQNLAKAPSATQYSFRPLYGLMLPSRRELLN